MKKYSNRMARTPLKMTAITIGLPITALITFAVMLQCENEAVKPKLAQESAAQAAEKPYMLEERRRQHVFVAKPTSSQPINEYVSEIESDLCNAGHEIIGIYPYDIHDKYRGPIIFLVNPKSAFRTCMR